jgi:hypothetical protein
MSLYIYIYFFTMHHFIQRRAILGKEAKPDMTFKKHTVYIGHISTKIKEKQSDDICCRHHSIKFRRHPLQLNRRTDRSRRGKQLRCEADYSPQSSTEVKNGGTIPPPPPSPTRPHGVMLN